MVTDHISPQGTPPPALNRPVVTVVESKGFSGEAAARIRRLAHVHLLDLERSELLKWASESDVLWVRLKHQIDQTVLAAAPRLRMIVSPTTGLNHIDLAAAQQRGIRVLSLRGEVDFLRNVRATAEHTLGMMLALMRRLPAAMQHAVNEPWQRDRFKGHEIYGKRVGLIGYGRIGQLVAGYLLALGAEVVAHDPHVSASQFAAGVQEVSLGELLRSSEIVSLHANLTDQNIGLLGAAELALMRPGSWLINTARGELIDEAALLEALQLGRLGGAALDVLCAEQTIDVDQHPLLAFARWHDNLLIAPHLGGCTFESMEKTEIFMADKLIQAIAQLWVHAEAT